MNKKEVLILDCPEIQFPAAFKTSLEEWCGVFQQKSITVRVIHQLYDIHDDAIVFLGDQFNVSNPCHLLSNISKATVYIGWNWYKQDTSMLPYFLHIYQDVVVSANITPDTKFMLGILNNGENSCPFLLRASDRIEKIGKYKRNHICYDYCCFSLVNYDWMMPSGKYKGVSRNIETGYTNHQTRRRIYLSSIFALDLQSKQDIQNGSLSQTIFEAMAYGCVVLSNNPHASMQTNGIVEYVGQDRHILMERMALFLQNPDYITNKQTRGYDFVRNYGTNEYSLSLLLDKLSFMEQVVNNQYSKDD